VLEVCVDSVEGVRQALAGGADRLELCGALNAGGITPPLSLIRWACQEASGRVMVMIRPCPGGFVASGEGLKCMRQDIETARSAGARGVVFGALREDRTLDVESTQALCRAAQGLDVTFHRAFDLIDDQPAALETLIQLGIPRVLTSGGQQNAYDGRVHLSRLVAQAARRITILVGGGVRPDNLVTILKQTGAMEFHTSARAAAGAVPQRQDLPHHVAGLAISLAAGPVPHCDARLVRQMRMLLDDGEKTLRPNEQASS
jgi:copper homeostasis protein